MKLKVAGVIKEIGRREYANRFLTQRPLLITTADEQDVCIKLQAYKHKEDHTQLVEELALEVGDKVLCGLDISSRKWRYTYITNIVCTDIEKLN